MKKYSEAKLRLVLDLVTPHLSVPSDLTDHLYFFQAPIDFIEDLAKPLAKLKTSRNKGELLDKLRERILKLEPFTGERINKECSKMLVDLSKKGPVTNEEVFGVLRACITGKR